MVESRAPASARWVPGFRKSVMQFLVALFFAWSARPSREIIDS
ncbi:MAG TPA: hypothetical protein PK308_07065 [Phycisphaerales bacterium]|nr:hypothetical protein [Phycisphaerales bacterium]